MREIRISPEVWAAIAERGHFGETEDDVLRRVFGLPQVQSAQSGRRGRGSKRYAVKKLRAKVESGHFVVTFEDGTEFVKPLPNHANKSAIRTLRDAAVEFALINGATAGQIAAVKKALTEAGYHLVRGAQELTMLRLTGRKLNDTLGIGAEHALYHRDGSWYDILERFPGALFDVGGYVVFKDKEAYEASPFLRHPEHPRADGRNGTLTVPDGISRIPGYVIDPRISALIA